MFCRNCGTNVTNMKYCPKCGTKVEASDEPYQEDMNMQTSLPKAEKLSGFDKFMYKSFYANGKLSYESAGKSYVIGILIIQLIQVLFTLIVGDMPTWSTAVLLIFILLDWYSLSKRGVKGVWKVWGLFVTPIYLLIRAKKTDKKYLLPILSLLCVVAAIGILVLQALLPNVNNLSNDDTSYIMSEYVKKQEKISEIDITNYLPTDTMTLNYTWIASETDSIPYYYNLFPQENHIVNFKGESEGDVILNYSSDGEKYITTGSFYYDEKKDCLIKTSQSAFGNYTTIDYLPSLENKLEQAEDVTVKLDDYLYTVYTKAGTYTDCVAVIERDSSTDTTYTSISYYAKGIGEILVINNYPDTSTMSVYTMLVSTNVIKDESSTPIIAEPTDVNFFDGQRFECFETESGEDIILTIRLFYSDDSDIPSSYKGELSNGVEFWFEPYENSSESVTYKVDCADGTNAYLEYSSSLSEITFTADKGTEYGNMFAYSGTYIGLPDVVEE